MNVLSILSAKPHIADALQQASERTGADFNYLLNTAMRESSLNCSAQSKTSSACGLFQFTRQTWLATLKTEGEALGLGQYADQIRRDPNGRFVVDDPAAREEILALRNNPSISALMAGAYANNSRDRLEARLGRDVSTGELYIAHFLGAGGASRLIRQTEQGPQARADALFPQAAAANKSIFYDKSGEPRSAGQLYDLLIAKHQGVKNQGETGLAPRPQFTKTVAKAVSVAAVPVASASIMAANPVIHRLDTMTVSGNVSGNVSGGRSQTVSRPEPVISASSMSMVNHAIGRPSIKLSPAVLNVLASLQAPEASEMASRDDRKDERKLANRFLPLGGFAFG